MPASTNPAGVGGVIRFLPAGLDEGADSDLIEKAGR